jgi:hypothetical protein
MTPNPQSIENTIYYNIDTIKILTAGRMLSSLDLGQADTYSPVPELGLNHFLIADSTLIYNSVVFIHS